MSAHAQTAAAVHVRRVRADDVAVVKRLRLASLAEAPYAFERTLEEERAFPEAMWRERTESNAEGVRTVGFFAVLEGVEQGMVVGVHDAERPELLYLNALWVAPAHRGKGAARALVEAVCDWARTCGCDEVRLKVTEHNDAAIALYRACGFEEIGERQPGRREPAVRELTMARGV